MSDENNVNGEDAEPGTAGALIAFLETAAIRGWINRGSARALKTAAQKMLSIEENWEALRLADLDRDEWYDRFYTLRHQEYNDASMRVYRTRFNQAVAMYLARVDGDPNWKSYGPSQRRTTKSTSQRAKAASQELQLIDESPAETSEMVDAVGTEPRRLAGNFHRSPSPAMELQIDHRFPLREDGDALLRLPRDLTQEEANRLMKFIDALATP